MPFDITREPQPTSLPVFPLPRVHRSENSLSSGFSIPWPASWPHSCWFPVPPILPPLAEPPRFRFSVCSSGLPSALSHLRQFSLHPAILLGLSSWVRLWSLPLIHTPSKFSQRETCGNPQGQRSPQDLIAIVFTKKKVNVCRGRGWGHHLPVIPGFRRQWKKVTLSKFSW